MSVVCGEVVGWSYVVGRSGGEGGLVGMRWSGRGLGHVFVNVDSARWDECVGGEVRCVCGMGVRPMEAVVSWGGGGGLYDSTVTMTFLVFFYD